MVGSLRAQAFARCLMKLTASSDHRLPATPTWLCDLAEPTLGRCAPSVALQQPEQHRRHLQLCGATHRKQGEAVPPQPPDGGHHSRELGCQGRHEDVCGDSPPCLTTDARRRALDCESTPSQNPRLSARCTMMAKIVKETATSAQARNRGAMGDAVDGAATPETAGIRSWSVGSRYRQELRFELHCEVPPSHQKPKARKPRPSHFSRTPHLRSQRALGCRPAPRVHFRAMCEPLPPSPDYRRHTRHPKKANSNSPSCSQLSVHCFQSWVLAKGEQKGHHCVPLPHPHLGEPHARYPLHPPPICMDFRGTNSRTGEPSRRPQHSCQSRQHGSSGDEVVRADPVN